MKPFLRFLLYLIVLIGVSSARSSSYDDFFRAVALDDARTVSALLARGFEPNAVGPTGQTALVTALQSEAPRVFELLLRHPQLTVDAVNAAGETALMMAALRGDVPAMRQLLERGAQIERPGWTPLHYAASGPEPAAVRLLVERGANIDARSPNGTTPLMMAARYGAIDAAVYLLQRGADPRARNELGLDAVDFAQAVERDRLAARLAQARDQGPAPR